MRSARTTQHTVHTEESAARAHGAPKSDGSGNLDSPATRAAPNACPCGGGCPRCSGSRGAHAGSHTHSGTLPIASAEALNTEGKPLDGATREFFESRFDRDLSDVRVHQGPAVRAAAHVHGAKAFAMGNDIAWPDTAPAMDSSGGRGLMAHELAHVVQQQHGDGAGLAPGGAVAEQEAKTIAGRVATAAPIAVSTATHRGVAFSVEEWLTGTPDLSKRSYNSLIEDIHLIREWMQRQTGTTPDVTRLAQALDELLDEVARRDAAPLAVPQPAPPPADASVPRVIAERRSTVYADVNDMRRDVNAMIAWLKRKDLSESERTIVQTELSNVEPLAGVIGGFGFNKSDIPGAEEWKVEQLARKIAAAPMVPVRLVGHTDPVGTHDYNVGLGARRAAEVQRQLNFALDGIGRGLSSVVQYDVQSPGEAEPVESNATEAGRKANRRVEVFVPVAGPTLNIPVPVPPVPIHIIPVPPVPPTPVVIPPHKDIPTIVDPKLPIDPFDIGKGSSVKDTGHKGSNPIWSLLTASASFLGLTLSAGISALSADVLSKAVAAALAAFELEGLGTAGVGLAGEMAAEVILEDLLGGKSAGVFNLNDIRKNFPLIDFLTANEAPSVKVFGILGDRSYDEVRSSLMTSFKQAIGDDWAPGSRYRKLTKAAQALFDNRDQIPKGALPDVLRKAKSVSEVEAGLKKIVTLRLPDDYVEPFRKDVVEYMAKKMGVSTNIKGTLLPGRAMTAADTRIIQSYLEKVQTIGLTSSDFKVLLETAKEIAAQKMKKGP